MVNLLPNASFESVEPPPLTAGRAVRGEAAPADEWLPRTWQVLAEGGAVTRCPDNPAAARQGRRHVQVAAARGSGGVRFGLVPVADAQPWQLTFQAQGTGRVAVVFRAYGPDQPVRLLDEESFGLTNTWTGYTHTFTPPAGLRGFHVDVVTRGPGQMSLDDVSLSHPALTPLNLPPTASLAPDADTLLWLAGDVRPDENRFFIKEPIEFTDGVHGRALRFGPEGYMAGSASEHLDVRAGTIECWFRLRAPGNNGQSQPLVCVPGPDGMWLGKDQYGHVGLGFGAGWKSLVRVSAQGYANTWAPDVWRHMAACWDADSAEVFVDGKLVAWTTRPALPRSLGPELGIGSPGLDIHELRISRRARYHVPVPPSE